MFLPTIESKGFEVSYVITHKVTSTGKDAVKGSNGGHVSTHIIICLVQNRQRGGILVYGG